MPERPGKSLPPLGGGLLLAYRFAWWGLCAAALGAIVHQSLFEATADPLVIAVRLVKSAIVIAVAAILLRRRSRDPVAALLSLALLIWSITSSVDFTDEAPIALALDRVRFALFVLALLLFPDGRWVPPWTRLVAFASAAVCLIGLGEVAGLLPTRIYLPSAIGCVLLALASLLIRFRHSRATERQQLKWVTLGLASGIGLILAARAGRLLQIEGPMASVTPALLETMFQLGIVLVALGFLVSLLRYRLFDVEAAVSRSAALAVLTAALVAIFAGSEALIEMLGQSWFGMGIGNVSAAMAAAVAAVVLAPLHSKIGGWAEERFQRDLVILKQQLPELLADLSVRSSSRRLANTALPKIAEAVHSTRIALQLGKQLIAARGTTLAEARRRLPRPDNAGHDDPFPIRLPMVCPFGRTEGWLLIGPRPDGTLYGKDEAAAIDAILPDLRRALAATAARDRAQRQMDRWRRETDRQILALSAAIVPPTAN